MANAVTIGTTGLSFGATAESGLLISSFSETRNIEKAEVRDATGNVVGIALYNQTDSISFSGSITGSYATTAGAVLTTLANATSTGGKIVVESVAFSKGSDAFVSVDVSATRYPNMS
jgi:hypothetical protein